MSALRWLMVSVVCTLITLPAKAEINKSEIEISKIEIVASIKPLALIAAEVLELVPNANVSVIVGRNASPHQFSLRPSHVQSLINASAILWLGADFEPYLEKTLSKIGRSESAITVNAVSGILLLEARSVDQKQAAEAHEHHGHHHDHSGTDDPHLWWSSSNALLIAQALAEHLKKQFPDNWEQIDKGLHNLERRLVSFKSKVKEIPGKSKASFVIYHDSLSYLEHELGLASQRRVAVSPEAKPSVRDLLSLKMMIVRGKVNCIVVEPNASQKFIQKVNPDNQARVVMIDPLGWDAKGYSDFWQRGVNALLDCK